MRSTSKKDETKGRREKGVVGLHCVSLLAGMFEEREDNHLSLGCKREGKRGLTTRKRQQEEGDEGEKKQKMD